MKKKKDDAEDVKVERVKAGKGKINSIREDSKEYR